MSEKSAKILLVDDDTALTELLSEYLTEAGMEVFCAGGADEALKSLEAQEIDLAVLDIMMPGMSGLELLPVIRGRWSMPVIMLTGRGEDIDRILGLEMGADDYLAKPANPRELLARIRAVLRRSEGGKADTPSAEIQLGSVMLNSNSRTVMASGEKLALTTAEFDVLAVLMASAGTAVSRDTLTQQVLHRELSPYDRSIDVHVSRVRNALKQALPDSELIVTIRGVGYQYVR